MTNAEIIFQNRVFLMEQEVIKGIPGTQISFKGEDGLERQILMPEEIHTFDGWKKLGWQVQKGQHAVAKFPIWKMAGKKKQAQADDEEVDKDQKGGKFFMKMSFFFTKDQCKEVGA